MLKTEDDKFERKMEGCFVLCDTSNWEDNDQTCNHGGKQTSNDYLTQYYSPISTNPTDNGFVGSHTMDIGGLSSMQEATNKIDKFSEHTLVISLQPKPHLIIICMEKINYTIFMQQTNSIHKLDATWWTQLQNNGSTVRIIFESFKQAYDMPHLDSQHCKKMKNLAGRCSFMGAYTWGPILHKLRIAALLLLGVTMMVLCA